LRDLLVIVPTRGRPGNVLRLVQAMTATCTAQTDLALAVDDDDVFWDEGVTWPSFVSVTRGPRRTCGVWSNEIASARGSAYRALASLGDDHVPHTAAWDSTMLAALDDLGGTGIVYGDDMAQRENLPTAPVLSSSIVAALGWFFYPPLIHYFADNVWLDLGRETGCLRYLPEVIIEHLHCTTGKSVRDQTYMDADYGWDPDHAAYRNWKANEMARDAQKIRDLQ